MDPFFPHRNSDARPETSDERKQPRRGPCGREEEREAPPLPRQQTYDIVHNYGPGLIWVLPQEFI